MSYQPKPGDKVTSPLLVGEWTVGSKKRPSWWEVYDKKGNPLEMYVGNLSPVAPPLPAELPVRSVVWAEGMLWQKGPQWYAHNGRKWVFRDWRILAADAEPVVAVSQVADWLRTQALGISLVKEFVERFGWPDE